MDMGAGTTHTEACWQGGRTLGKTANEYLPQYLGDGMICATNQQTHNYLRNKHVRSAHKLYVLNLKAEEKKMSKEHELILFYGLIVFHGVYVPHFLYPVYY